MSRKSAEALRALELTRLALEAPPDDLFEPTAAPRFENDDDSSPAGETGEHPPPLGSAPPPSDVPTRSRTERRNQTRGSGPSTSAHSPTANTREPEAVSKNDLRGSPATAETVASRKGPRPADESVKIGLRVTQGLLYDFRMLVDAEGVGIAEAIGTYLARCLEARQILIHESDDEHGDPERMVPTDLEYVPSSTPAFVTALVFTRKERQTLRVLSKASGVPIADGIRSFMRACVLAGRIIGDEA